MTRETPFTRYGKRLAPPRDTLDANEIKAQLYYEAEALAVLFPGPPEAPLVGSDTLYWGWGSARRCGRKRWFVEDRP